MLSEKPTEDQTPSPSSVVLFDGVCNLCNGFVNWIIARDPHAQFRFVPLQSIAGQALALQAGLDPTVLGTLVVIDSGTVMIRSTGILWIVERLDTPLAKLARVGKFVPGPVRDVGYRVVARTRYRIFGRQESCRIPTTELMEHFLNPDDAESAIRIAGIKTV